MMKRSSSVNDAKNLQSTSNITAAAEDTTTPIDNGLKLPPNVGFARSSSLGERNNNVTTQQQSGYRRSNSNNTKQSIESSIELESSRIINQNHNNNNNSNDNISHGFMSDPSISEEEYTAANDNTSSKLDYQKKLLYKQRLREFDASSVGDTSLSSSNMSLNPGAQRYRFHFGGDNASQSSSIRSDKGKKVRNKVNRYSPSNRMMINNDMIQRQTPPSGSSSGSGGGGGVFINNMKGNTSTTADAASSHDEEIAMGEHQIQMMDEVSSASDSVRGIDITQNNLASGQYGGEDSGPRPKQTPQILDQADLEKRTRRKSQQGNNNSPHRRIRSGDKMAATMMNSGREDWIPMRQLQERSISHETWSNESSSLLGNNNNNSNLQHQQQQQQRERVATWDGSRDGYSAGSSAVTSHRNQSTPNLGDTRQGQQQYQQHVPQRLIRRNNSELSGTDTFCFSDDSAGGDGAGESEQQYIPHSSSFDPNFNRASAFPSHHHQRYASQVLQQPPPSTMYSNNQNNMPWFSSYQQSNDRGSFRANDDILRHYNRRQHESESVIQSDGSTSGESVSCTSSSYTDNSERMMEIEAAIRRSPPGPHHKTVHFRSATEDTKFDKVMKRVQSVLDKPLYRLDKIKEEDSRKNPMFYCPNCKTHQRDFINFATASSVYDSPQGYLALYFALYLVSSLFVFGLEEGWAPLDCVYFSMITLTTAGLGDFVPSTDGGKILCACFIYVGVATIGLLLGSLLAGKMDKAQSKEAREAQIRDCPTCLRLSKSKQRSMGKQLSATPNYQNTMGPVKEESDQELSCTPSDTANNSENEAVGLDLFGPTSDDDAPVMAALPTKAPSSAQKQAHTRHMSIDVGGNVSGSNLMSKIALRRTGSGDGRIPAPIDESTPFLAGTPSVRHRSSTETRATDPSFVEMRELDDSYSSSSSSTTDSDYSSVNPSKPMTRVKAAKYTFLTLKQALVNSLYIISVGSFGFYYIEGLSAVDSFYFTTVLLTSVGYGDIVPHTPVGKLFATIFVVIAGTVLLHNMTLISMIPLELRKRRVEHAVLGQFGSNLTDDELRELSTGRLINRLKLATNRPDGLEECTREMFSLAMLVRLGRITENDVKATFAAFRRLDVGNYGTLNSRTIIEGELMRRKSLRNLSALSPDNQLQQQQDIVYTSEFNMPQQPTRSLHHRKPTPMHMSPGSYNNMMSNPSLARRSSDASYHSQSFSPGGASYNVYDFEHWQYGEHYSPPPKNTGTVFFEGSSSPGRGGSKRGAWA